MMKRSPVCVISGEVFCHESEDLEKVSKAFELFFPKKSIIQKKQEVSLGTKIVILSSQVEKKKARELAEKILNKLTYPEKKQVLEELQLRLSEDGKLYLRLDKQLAFEKEEMHLTKEEDSIQIVLSLEAFPAKYPNFVNVAKELLSG